MMMKMEAGLVRGHKSPETCPHRGSPTRAVLALALGPLLC